MTDDLNNKHGDLKRFEMGTRRRRRLREAAFPSRMFRDRPNVRLDRELLDRVRTAVQGEPDLKLQDAFDEALMLWLRVREYNAAGMSLFATPMQLKTLAI